MRRLVQADIFNYPFREQSVAQQRVIRMIMGEPFHNLRRLRVKNELASFESDGGSRCHTPAEHNALDVFQRKVLVRLLIN